MGELESDLNSLSLSLIRLCKPLFHEFCGGENTLFPRENTLFPREKNSKTHFFPAARI